MKTSLALTSDETRRSYTGPLQIATCGFHTPGYFQQFLCLERKRRERSRRPMPLLLIDIVRISEDERDTAAKSIARALTTLTRAIDIKGWYDEDRTIGVIFTECNEFDKREIMKKTRDGLERELGPVLAPKVSLSFHIFPQDEAKGEPRPEDDPVLYPEVRRKYGGRFGPFLLKRAIDVAGGIAGFDSLFSVLRCHPDLHQADLAGPGLLSAGACRAVRQEVHVLQVQDNVREQRRAHSPGIRQEADLR